MRRPRQKFSLSHAFAQAITRSRAVAYLVFQRGSSRNKTMNKPYIFGSYSRHNREFAEKLGSIRLPDNGSQVDVNEANIVHRTKNT